MKGFTTAPRLLIFGVIFVSAGLQVAIAPLLPTYVHQLSLSGLQTGALVGASGFAMAVVSLPVGSLADRLGARRLTLGAGWLLALGALAQSEPRSFGLLLASRLVFGLGYAVIWSAGLAWLTGPARRGSDMGIAVACSGAGGVIAPAFASFLAGAFGVAAPFLVSGVVLVALTVGLSFVGSGAVEPASKPRGGKAQFGSALVDTRTIAALGAVVAAGISTALATLLIPLELHSAGTTTDEIGMAFSAAGVVFVIVCVATTLLGRRAFRIATALGAILALMVVLAPGAISATQGAVVFVLCASTATRGALWSVAYPLGAAGGERTGTGVGAITGLLNTVWAATTLVVPILAGALVSHAGVRATFGAAQITLLGVLAASVAGIAWQRSRYRGHDFVVPARSRPNDLALALPDER